VERGITWMHNTQLENSNPMKKMCLEIKTVKFCGIKGNLGIR
jgi:hypothetical protein